jgi:hypothetical protein
MADDPLKAQHKSLRFWLDWLLGGGYAHVGFDDAVRGLPPKLRGARAPGLPHTAWELLEHIRIAQWDILDFSHNPHYAPRAWPENYWPKHPAPKKDEWEKSVRQCKADMKAIRKMVCDPHIDLLAPFPWDEDKNLLREVLVLADHNSYHLGQLVLVRRALGVWQ